MSNKQQIQKLRDNAELAMAAYGYFHFIGKKFKDKKDEQGNLLTITHTGILDLTYKGCKVKDTGLIFDDELKGDFAPLQAQRFFSRYDLLIHQPNTESGFSATLFKDTKADSKDSEYTLAIRGTEFKLEQIKDIINDYYIGTNNDDLDKVIEQYFDMLLFYEEIIKPLMQEKGVMRINVVGHSLGGYLTQLFALSYSHIINEVYTYNTSLESKKAA